MQKKRYKYTLIIIGLLFIQGCANHTNFVKKYDGWVGKNITQLIGKIGYPDSTFLLPNKNKVYVYEKNNIQTAPSTSISYGYGGGYYGNYGMFGLNYGTSFRRDTCKLFVETNKKGKILKWGSRGNHCVSN